MLCQGCAMPRGGPEGNSNAISHGLYSLKARLNGDGMDRRTSLFKALAAKERELAVALGGDPSPQEKAIIADTVKTLLYIGSLDAYLTQLKTLVHKGRVRPALIERTRLAGHLRENLKSLGLKRVVKTISLQEYLAQPQDSEGSNGSEGQ